MKVEVLAIVKKVKFQSDRSNWGIITGLVREVISSAWTGPPDGPVKPNQAWTMKGAIGEPVVGEEVIASGRLIIDPKWGLQLDLETPLQARGIESLQALQTYLDSAPHIGPERAQAILRLGRHDLVGVYQLLGAGWEQLEAIPGITRQRAAAIHAWYESTLAHRAAIQFLAALPIPPALQRRVLLAWRDTTETRIREDPFALMSFDGVGFKTANDVATTLGVDRDSPKRLAACVIHLLQTAAEEGHTYLPSAVVEGAQRPERNSAVERAFVETNVSGSEFAAAAKLAIAGQSLPIDLTADGYALRRIAYAEASAARELREMGAQDLPPLVLPDMAVLFQPLTPAAAQMDAVRMFAQHPISILTGGPGTGKSATTKAVIELAHLNGLTVYSVAPSGRAAVRLAELTGHPAATIHRQLQIHPELDAEEIKLACDVLIVDETSMVDIELAARLLRAASWDHQMRILFVGDVDQLPPVGPGAFFADLIASGTVPVTRLTEIFRQAAESPIPHVARAIRDGRTPALEKSDGYAFVDTTADGLDQTALAVRTQSVVVQAMTKWIVEKGRGGAKDISDIVCITPQRNGACGVHEINKIVSGLVNAGKSHCVKYGDVEYYTGDRVMHLQNDYDLDTFNGEMGRVVAIDEKGRAGEVAMQQFGADVAMSGDSAHVVVEYPTGTGKRLVGYARKHLGMLTPAYAVTTHKMQGSSAPVVVVPVTSQHQWMLTRRLLYTAVTRAERYLLVVGEKAALQRAIQSTRNDVARSTRLHKLLTQATNALDWFNSLV